MLQVCIVERRLLHVSLALAFGNQSPSSISTKLQGFGCNGGDQNVKDGVSDDDSK
jgi:hypothetical protein